jgi:hypothetical protein
MKERSDERTERLATSAKLLLDEGLNDLSYDTTIRLQRARLRALEGPSPRRPWLLWAGGAVLASAIMLMAVLWQIPLTTDNHGHLPLIEDLELVTSPENVDISEDLEFYDWLADATSRTG